MICRKSKYAETQGWRVDPVDGTKTAYTLGKKQLVPLQARVDVRLLAEEILLDPGATEPKWTARTDEG